MAEGNLKRTLSSMLVIVGAVWNWSKHPSHLLSLAALGLSLLTFIFAEERRTRDLPFDLIPKAYEKYYEMNKIEIDRPYLTHLFVNPELYDGIKQVVKQSVGTLTPEKRAEYLLQERSAADFIFTFYEQNLFQWDATRDKERKFISDTLDYLRGYLLRNPRLIYWWQKNSGALESSYQEKTRSDWEVNISRRLDRSKEGWCDALGPFEIDVSQKGTSCSSLQ